ncbi:FkbM family methyltransferase [Mycolicibacterium sp. BK556]|uniref:FkbM family methyltransferase n=1 Tax=unclassified Mycolicibacterium TaxID=2636767 RepID=UPI00161F2165|nr:FkbM family methyltransferase [Mycolicibacterium sp. BK556]MBB3634178.1 FkbM family methyltransferase [Mycolicibacterium sp. BK607]
MGFLPVRLRTPPHGGTPTTLPNGMRIHHWQQIETGFLYKEIFGADSVYAKGDFLDFQPGAVIVDAGANIGLFSLFAALRCHGEAEIFAFEPIPTTFSVLAANAAAANRGDYAAAMGARPGASLTIHPINCGLSDARDEVIFQHHPNFSMWSTQDAEFARQRLDRFLADLAGVIRVVPSAISRAAVRPVVAWMGRTTDVTATLIPLSSVIEKHGLDRIDVLKIDVEGAEVAALQGIRPAQWEIVRQVVLEVEYFAAKDRVIEILESHGFTTYWYASERERYDTAQSEVCMVYAWRAADRG